MYRNTNCALQAHRGVSTDAPENTMAAFSAAVSQGYDLIEFDPKFTKDNVCVILHDRTLNRTGRISGKELTEEVKIADKNFAELSAFEVGSWFGEEFAGEPIPTLAEALGFMKDSGIEAKIDNVWQSFTDEQIEILFTIIEKYGGRVGVTCTDLNLLKRFALRFPSAPLHYDGAADDDSLAALSSFSGGHVTTVWARLDTPLTSWCKVAPVSEELSEKVHSPGFRLGVWMLANDEEMSRALELGADIVETTGAIKP